jgi:cytochrome P450
LLFSCAQEILRKEIEEVWPTDEVPDMETLSNLKNFHMVMQETLRICPPIYMTARRCLQENKVGSFTVHKGVEVQVKLVYVSTGVYVLLLSNLVQQCEANTNMDTSR